MFDKAIKAGAVGGKILGAGGGGFMLLFVTPDKQPAVREALAAYVHVPFRFEDSGSRVVVYQPDGF
jgi:D-glycero-alpha-D-manno-heptose-7-phosphate kinase